MLPNLQRQNGQCSENERDDAKTQHYFRLELLIRLPIGTENNATVIAKEESTSRIFLFHFRNCSAKMVMDWRSSPDSPTTSVLLAILIIPRLQNH